MEKTNLFSYFQPQWNLSAWQAMTSEGTCVRFDSLDELPKEVKLPDSLTGKINAVAVGCSACNSSMTFVMQLYRVDANDPMGYAIDQQTLVANFENESGSYFGGFIMHGDWSGRTIYPTKLQEEVAKCGVTANIEFLGKQSEKVMTWKQLTEAGIINGFMAPMSMVENRKESVGQGKF